MCNYESDKTIELENEKIEKVKKYTYLGQTTTTSNRTKEEITTRVRKAWLYIWKIQRNLSRQKLAYNIETKSI